MAGPAETPAPPPINKPTTLSRSFETPFLSPRAKRGVYLFLVSVASVEKRFFGGRLRMTILMRAPEFPLVQ